MKASAVLNRWFGIARSYLFRGLPQPAASKPTEPTIPETLDLPLPEVPTPTPSPAQDTSVHLPDTHAPSRRATSAQFLAGTYTSEIGSLDYRLFIPSCYRGQSLPLVVMLHGCKQDPVDFARGTRMNELAEERQCLVVYPAQAPSANGFRCWNWFNAVNQERDHGEPSMIAGITRDIVDTFNIDRSRVYVAGLSAGGAMAVIMGTTYPDLYSAVGVHSGLAYKGASDLYSAIMVMRSGMRFVLQNSGHPPLMIDSERVVPTIVFHGGRDTTVHPSNGDQVLEQSILGQGEGAPTGQREPIIEEGAVQGGHAFTRTIYQNAVGLPLAEQWLVHGGGHAWSGGSVEGSYTDPLGPDASGEMLRFFFSHPRPA